MRREAAFVCFEKIQLPIDPSPFVSGRYRY